MTIPFAEAPEQSGPAENQYGLDEMTRVFIGQASLLEAFRLTKLPGLQDDEYVGMRIVSFTPEDHSGTGDLKRVTIKYSGQAYPDSNTTGNWKPPQISSDLSRQTTSQQVTQTRSFEQLVSYTNMESGGVSNLIYAPVSQQASANLEIEFYAHTVTYRHTRDYHPVAGSVRFMAEAEAYLAAASVDIISQKTTQEEPWPDLPTDQVEGATTIPGYRNLTTSTASEATLTSKIRLANISCRQNGTWFEIDETWEKVYGS